MIFAKNIMNIFHISCRKVVDSGHSIATGEAMGQEVRSDKSGNAGDEDFGHGDKKAGILDKMWNFGVENVWKQEAAAYCRRR